MPNLVIKTIAALAIASALAGPGKAEGDLGAYLAARVAEASNDFRASAAWYARALIADSANTKLLESAILAQMSLGDFSLASQGAKQLVTAGVKSQIADFALIAAESAAEDYAGLLDGAAKGRTIGKLVDDLLIGWATLGQGKMTEALASFDTMATTKGLEAFGLYHKALALAFVGDFEGADGILSGKTNGPINLMRRGVMAHVQILSQLERNPEAIALLDRNFGPAPNPMIDPVRDRLAAGEPLPFDVVRNARDGIAEVFFSVATALNGDSEAGFTLLHARIAAHLRPDHSDAVLLTAQLLSDLGQFDLASETYALFTPDHPSFFVAEIGRANELRAAGKDSQSIEVLQALAVSHGDILVVQSALGDALRRAERFAEALVAYDAAVAVLGDPAPQDWTLFFSRAICHEKVSDWPLAEADFRKALSLNPDQPQVLNYLGYSFVDRGENLDEALVMIERAVKLEPRAGYIIDSLAWAYYRLGRFDDALAPMERASVLTPVDPVVTDHLGDVYWSVGRKREAQFQWHRALSFGPTEKDAIRIRRKLEAGLDVVLQDEAANPAKPVDAAAATDN